MRTIFFFHLCVCVVRCACVVCRHKIETQFSAIRSLLAYKQRQYHIIWTSTPYGHFIQLDTQHTLTDWFSTDILVYTLWKPLQCFWYIAVKTLYVMDFLRHFLFFVNLTCFLVITRQPILRQLKFATKSIRIYNPPLLILSNAKCIFKKKTETMWT